MKIINFVLFFLFSFGVFFITIPVFAETQCNPKTEVCLTDPLGIGSTTSGPQQLIGRIIKGVLGLVGSLALAMFVYGGFTWMLSAGNSTNVEKGKQILIWATIGLVVIFSAYAMLKFVFEGLGVG